MSIKILKDGAAWKVVRKSRGRWVVVFRGSMDACHDYARGLADDLRANAQMGA